VHCIKKLLGKQMIVSNLEWRRFSSVFLIIALVSLTSCKTTDLGLGLDIRPDGQQDGEQAEESQVEYNFFWDQHNHLNDLIAEKKYDEADAIFGKHEAFFAKDLKSYRPDLEKLAKVLNGKKAKSLSTSLHDLGAISWPAPVTE
jgi:hypothetical protein